MEEEKARHDFENGYSGYWRNCQWIQTADVPLLTPREVYTDTGTEIAVDFGTDCQPGSTTGVAGALVDYSSDSTDDTGMLYDC